MSYESNDLKNQLTTVNEKLSANGFELNKNKLSNKELKSRLESEKSLNVQLNNNYVDAKTMRRQWFRESEYIFPQVAKGVKDILRAGGRVGFGSHGQYQGLGYHWAMWAMSAGGASSIEILNIATLKGAEVIGRASEIGSLEPGKYADLVILDKDPRVNIRNTTSISKVMKNGRIYDGRTMDQIFPDQKPLPKQWFWDKEPK